MNGSSSGPVPDEEAVVASVEGRPLVAPGHRTRGRCRRCERKNAIRRRLDAGSVRDPAFDDGADVRLDVVAAERAAAEPPERRWQVTAAYHRDHPPRPREAVVRSGGTQARLRATLRADGWLYQLEPGSGRMEWDPDALVVYDADVVWLSPPEAGTPPDDGSGTDRLAPDDPRPDWPPAENAWRERLVRDARTSGSGSGSGSGSDSDFDPDAGPDAR